MVTTPVQRSCSTWLRSISFVSTFSAPEAYQTAVKTDETVTLTLDAFPGEAFTGTIVRNSNSIDLTSRTLNVEVDGGQL